MPSNKCLCVIFSTKCYYETENLIYGTTSSIYNKKYQVIWSKHPIIKVPPPSLGNWRVKTQKMHLFLKIKTLNRSHWSLWLFFFFLIYGMGGGIWLQSVMSFPYMGREVILFSYSTSILSCMNYNNYIYNFSLHTAQTRGAKSCT
jgi:hypothetical protein